MSENVYFCRHIIPRERFLAIGASQKSNQETESGTETTQKTTQKTTEKILECIKQTHLSAEKNYLNYVE